MNRFQQGSLFKVKRKRCAGVWVFRWYDYTTGRRIYKKQIIGTTGQLRSRRDAEKAVVALRGLINVDVGTPQTVCDRTTSAAIQAAGLPIPVNRPCAMT